MRFYRGVQKRKVRKRTIAEPGNSVSIQKTASEKLKGSVG